MRRQKARLDSRPSPVCVAFEFLQSLHVVCYSGANVSSMAQVGSEKGLKTLSLHGLLPAAGRNVVTAARPDAARFNAIDLRPRI